MRIRQIKPEFWKDAKMADLSEGTRLFFIGTWQLADDAGWIRWDVANIAAELYPFQSRSSRERRVIRHSESLAKLGRLHLHECGHAQVPTMPAHQHLAGTTRRVTTVLQEHHKCLVSDKPATPRDSPRLPAPVSIGSVGIGSVSNHARAGEFPKGRHLDVVDGEWQVKEA